MDVLRLACLGMTFLSMSPSADAAPFVLGAPRSLAARIADSRAAVIATPAGDESTDGWRVETCLHDVTGAVAAGDVIHPTPAPSPDHPAALLLARRDRRLEAVPLTAAARDYLEELPSKSRAIEQRLPYAFSHLDHRDRIVCADAFATLACVSGVQLRRCAERFPVETLRTLVSSDETSDERAGFYAYLLGLAGQRRDAALIRHRLDGTDNGLATGAAGLIAGYLLLTGEEGLAELEGTILMANRRTPIFVAALYEALQTLGREHPELFSPERLRQTARCGLNRTDSVDLAIGYLASQRDWEALPEVSGALGSDDPDPVRRRAVRIAAARFLMACRRDSDASPARRAQAVELLQRLAEVDADLVRRAQRIAGGPPPRN